MTHKLTLLGAASVGAGLIYFFDPDSRRRRLAHLRDRIIHLTHMGTRAVNVVSTDVPHRVQGLVAELSAMRNPVVVDDDVLAERVRAMIGRLVRHPGSIDVVADEGRVALRGPVLADEVQHLLRGTSHVPGVREVINQLDVHESPENVPGLQGQPGRDGERFGALAQNWDPTTRFLVGGIGAALMTYGLFRRRFFGIVVEATGLSVVARALTNIPFGRLFGVSGGRRAVDVQKTINISAPVNDVFALWAHPERFPLVMEHVESVRAIGPNRTVWRVRGPAGIAIHWEAITTRLIPNEEIAWKTVPGAIVGNAGSVRFQPNPDGSTRVDIKMSYMPPLGVVGHLGALLLGADPKHVLDDDLVRFKSLIECGKTTVHHHEVDRAELAA